MWWCRGLRLPTHPTQMMDALDLDYHQPISLTPCVLDRGTYVKFQGLNSDYAELADLRAMCVCVCVSVCLCLCVSCGLLSLHRRHPWSGEGENFCACVGPRCLDFDAAGDVPPSFEVKMRDYFALTSGSTITFFVDHLEKVLEFRVLEVRSHQGPCAAVLTLDTDLELDFDRPADATPEEVCVQFFSAHNSCLLAVWDVCIFFPERGCLETKERSRVLAHCTTGCLDMLWSVRNRNTCRWRKVCLDCFLGIPGTRMQLPKNKKAVHFRSRKHGLLVVCDWFA